MNDKGSDTHDLAQPDLPYNRRTFLAKAGKLSLLGGLLASHPEWLASSGIANPAPPATSNDLIYLSATKLAAMIRDKQISSEELVGACLRRIEQVNRKINAVVQLAAERALAEAKTADATLARGKSNGPLHGVPFTVKDMFETEGLISTAGTIGRAQFVPAQDATVVARLRAAGAILLGKTNLSELAASVHTDNLVYGRTNNPFDLTRSVSGSSGGSAAILAVGGVPLEVGSDSGGSIRQPAHYCGVVGLKPTGNRVSRGGCFPPLAGKGDRAAPGQTVMFTVGPMARWVEDLILTLPLLAGPDPRDASIVDMPIGDPSALDLKSLRVAYFTTGATAEVANVTEAAAKTLIDFGVAVRKQRPSVFLQGSDLWGALYWPGGGDDFRRLLALAGTKESQVSSLLSSQLSDARISDATYQSSLSRWETYKTAMLAFMDNFDVILTPPSPTPAVAHGGNPDYSFLTDFNVAGWPAVVVRCGTSSSGLPIGVQIIAKPWREDIVLAVAKFLEMVMGGWKPVPQPTLGLLRQPAGLRLTWKGYGTLQSAPSPNGPWNDDSSAKSPYTATSVDMTARFFRVRQ